MLSKIIDLKSHAIAVGIDHLLIGQINGQSKADLRIESFKPTLDLAVVDNNR